MSDIEALSRRSASVIGRALAAGEASPVALAELHDADEVFATSTAGGVMPVTSIGAHTVASGKPGAITNRLIEAYWAAHTRGDGWSVPVADVPRGKLDVA